MFFAHNKFFRSSWNLNEGKAWVNNARIMKGTTAEIVMMGCIFIRL